MYQIAQDHCLYEGFKSELALACVSLTLTQFFFFEFVLIGFRKIQPTLSLKQRAQ
jgi:hypothetical protein